LRLYRGFGSAADAMADTSASSATPRIIVIHSPMKRLKPPITFAEQAAFNKQKCPR